MAAPLAIVEDDSSALNLMERLFAVAFPDMPIHAVSSPAALLADLEALAPAVVITDHHLNGMDGVELAQAVKRAAPETRVLMVSVDYTAAIHAALAAGHIDRFVQKPFDLSDLIVQVQALLSPAS